MQNEREAKYEAIIQELDGKTLRAFLTELVLKNDEAGRFLMERFGQEASSCAEAEKKLKALELKYEIESPMEYGKTCRFLEEIMAFLCEETVKPLRKEDTETVLEVCLMIVHCLGKARMEQEGELDSIGIRLYDTLKRLTGTREKREMVRQKLSVFCMHETENPLHAWLAEFLREELDDRESLEAALEELKRRLLASENREIPWFAPYHGREDAGKKSFLYMQKLGKTPEAFQAFAEETKLAPAIRRMQIRLMAEEGRLQEALEQLEQWRAEEKDAFRRRELEQLEKNLKS